MDRMTPPKNYPVPKVHSAAGEKTGLESEDYFIRTLYIKIDDMQAWQFRTDSAQYFDALMEAVWL